MTRDSILNFLGGLFAFLGGLFALIAAFLPLWQRAVARGYKHFLRAIAIIVIEIGLYIGALVMYFAFKNQGIAVLFLVAYLIVVVIEFGLRPWEIQRGELAFFVLWVAATCSIVAVLVLHVATTK